MKHVLLYLLLFTGMACRSPMPITANPSDHTSTSGTAGSAKMTTELPRKPDNVPMKKDSLPPKKDSLHLQSGRQ
jgi:hypothetical protein